MTKTNYSQYVIQELRAPFSAEMNAGYAKMAHRILWIDDNVVPGAFQMNNSWYFKPNVSSPPPHTHDVGEILGFFGNDPDDPYNLHGEVEIWLGDQQFNFETSAMVYIPPGLKHCPLLIKRIDQPIFHFSVVTTGSWDAETLKETHTSETDYSKYIIKTLQAPDFGKEFNQNYAKFAKRILYLDEDVIPGAYQMNVSWYCNPAEHVTKPHVHETDEIIGFFGGNPDDRYNLNGEVEIWMGDEKFTLTESALLFAPAGMPHCPLIIHRADQPIFHFSIIKGGVYESTSAK